MNFWFISSAFSSEGSDWTCLDDPSSHPPSPASSLGATGETGLAQDLKEQGLFFHFFPSEDWVRGLGTKVPPHVNHRVKGHGVPGTRSRESEGCEGRLLGQAGNTHLVQPSPRSPGGQGTQAQVQVPGCFLRAACPTASRDTAGPWEEGGTAGLHLA